MVKYSFSNSKMNKLARHLGLKLAQAVSFDLPAGWTCSKADICKTFSNRETGKLNRVGRVLCYAAKGEAFAPSARRLRWHNFDELRACGKDIDKMVALLTEAMPKNVKVIRIHSSGDFYSREYFLAWVKFARSNPDVTIYGYTKHLDYAAYDDFPENLYMQYSFGGLDDERMKALEIEIPTCYIGEGAEYPGLDIVCATQELGYQDYEAILNRKSFVIPIH